MTIAAAQTIPKRGNIVENLNDHYRMINMAADHGARLILFPELSISGYEREMAESLEFIPADPRLDKLRKLAINRDIVIIAGAPVRQGLELFIGAFIFSPNGTENIYTKQYLHDGEEIYYVSGTSDGLQITLEEETFSVAICADITNPVHPMKAAALNSSIYLASIFYTPNGISAGYEDLQKYAEELSMNVLMSNFGGPSYGMEAAGKSAFWDKTGKLTGGFEGDGEGLLIVRKCADIWETKLLSDLDL